MAHFEGLTPNSGLTEVLRAFPRNSKPLLHLLNSIMCADGELSRGQRETIAAIVSQQNDVAYCAFYHSLFAEVLTAPNAQPNVDVEPLAEYARRLIVGDSGELDRAFMAALSAGWSQAALYETVEVVGIFNFINTIVKAAGLVQPQARPCPMPTAEGLAHSYMDMAESIGSCSPGPVSSCRSR